MAKAPITYANLAGSYLFDEQYQLLEKREFSLPEQLKELQEQEKQLTKQSPPPQQLSREAFSKISQQLYATSIQALRNANLFATKQLIKSSFKPDTLVLQTINHIKELEKISNMLAKRMREWYGYYLPELARKIQEHEAFANLILKHNKKELLNELHLSDIESMGAVFKDQDLTPIKILAQQFLAVLELKKQQEYYLSQLVQEHFPNLYQIATPLIAARLIAKAGSLQRLALLPASTVQLLGAEKALFRHLRTGAAAPKYGVLLHHPLVTKVPPKHKGKMARMLANKISIAAKVDYYQTGKTDQQIMKRFVQELEKKAEQLQRVTAKGGERR